MSESPPAQVIIMKEWKLPMGQLIVQVCVSDRGSGVTREKEALGTHIGSC